MLRRQFSWWVTLSCKINPAFKKENPPWNLNWEHWWPLKILVFREIYTNLTLSFFQRRILGKFRLGCLPLHLKTGRYQVPRLPEDQRICLTCDTDSDIENESHFMFKCSAYKDERDSWLSKMTLPDNFMDQSDADKFKVVLNNPANIKHTANFILTAFNLRGKMINWQYWELTSFMTYRSVKYVLHILWMKSWYY